MQYKNPIDQALIDAAKEAHAKLVSLAELAGVSPDTGVTLQLKLSIKAAEAEMKLQAEAVHDDFAPPTSMD